MTKVLVTGATGLVGQVLCELLQSRGYDVSIIVRFSEEKQNTPYKAFLIDYDNHSVEEGALDGVDYIIHLAGTPISMRWTKAYKKLIIDSRVVSADILLTAIQRKNMRLKAFISASAVGYYGAITSKKIFTEDDVPADDFLGQVCQAWEQKAQDYSNVADRVVVLRTSGVLSNKGGLLAEIKEPVEKNVGSPLGSGRQYVPWIHVDDMAAMYLKAIEDPNMQGAYNAAAPEEATNKVLIKKIARQLKKHLWFPRVPAFMLKVMFGQMSSLILKGSRVSSEKIIKQGFKFKFETLESALKDLFPSAKK